MKRQNFDASSYTDYIRKKTNTALVQSGNFKNKKSITSTPPSYLDILTASIQQEYEIPIVQPVIPEPLPDPPSPPVLVPEPFILQVGTYTYELGPIGDKTLSWDIYPSSSVLIEIYMVYEGFDEFGDPVTVYNKIYSYIVDTTTTILNQNYSFPDGNIFYEIKVISLTNGMSFIASPRLYRPA